MDQERWLRVRQVFEAALERAPDVRAPYLDEVCAGDADLRARAQALLDADSAANQLLDSDAPAFDVGAFDTPERPPPHIGRYRILDELGRGGMGVVYRAERADGAFDRAVALKLVRGGFDSDDIRARFYAEGRILGNLEHPNVARLYDAGLAEDGRPYLVMELVEGEPIDRYCDARHLGVRDRIRLFLDVCEAVEYAHRNLIIHRDLKPSNVLVDRDGSVKLLDFGIAKLTESEPSAPTTGAGHRLLTPEYAAPEQIRGDPLTTSADVYALGVILYELLTGRRPFEDSARAVAVALGFDPTTQPPAPSRAVTESARQSAADGRSHRVPAAELGRRRATTTDRLRRSLQGDIDRVLLKALERDGADRYSSVEALSEDLRRYLVGHPIRIRPPSLAYRTRKFVRRHLVGVAATAAVTVSIAAGAGAAVFQARAAERERDLAVRVSDFLAELFEAPDPFAEERLDTLNVAALLGRGVARVHDELGNQPEVQARMLSVLGKVHLSLGLLPEARALLEDALAAAEGLYGDDRPEVAAARHGLARVLAEQAEYDDAERLYRSALDARRRDRSPGPVAQTLSWLGELLREHSRFDEALEALAEAVEIRRALAAESGASEELASSLGMLASLHQNTGQYGAAEQLRREALEIRQATLEPGHPLIADALSNLAVAVYQLGRLDEAITLQEEALGMYRSALADPHPKLANALNTMGVLLMDDGQHDRSLVMLDQALAMRRGLYGNDHPRVATTLNNRAYTVWQGGDLAGAETTYRESLALHRRLYGGEHLEVARLLNNLGALLRAAERYAESEVAGREAVEIMERLVGDEPPTAIMKENWAGTLRRLGRFDEAVAAYRAALDIFATRLPDDSLRAARVRLGLGGTLRELRRYEEAESLLLEAERHLAADSILIAEITLLYEASGLPRAQPGGGTQ